MRFQQPIMESCSGDTPLHACTSFIDKTRMTFMSLSIMRNVMKYRTAYRAVTRGAISFGRDNWIAMFEGKLKCGDNWSHPPHETVEGK